MSFAQLDTLRPVSAAEFLANPPAPRAHLLHPWLREREAVMLFAATGAGKSQVAMTIALAVAGGREAFGWSAPEPRPVLFVDGEMDRGDLADRIRLLRDAIDAGDDCRDLENLHILARDMHRPGVPFPDLGTDEGHAEVLAFAQEVGASLVVLDNLSTLATVEDENSASAIRKPTELVQKLRQAGCATLLVHHSDKSGANYRGSSNLATTFAWVIGLHRPDSAEPGMDVRMEFHKTRGSPDGSLIPKRLRLATDDDGSAAWEVGEPEGLQAVRLAKAIRSRLYRNVQEAGEAIGLKRSQAFAIARKLEADAGMTKAERDRCFAEAAELDREQADAGEDGLGGDDF